MSFPAPFALPGLPPALRALVDRLQERRARTTADRSLAERLRKHLRRVDACAAAGLSFYAHDGTVAVYGLFPSLALREQVLAVVAQQPGVRRIVDHTRLPET
ncbi:MAG: hypothetical protein ACK41D_03270 [Rubricoccaceae bacterium]